MRFATLRFVMLAIGSVAFLTACGDEWKAMSKKGNTWEYEITKGESKVTIVSKVVEVYAIGKRTYAEIGVERAGATNSADIYTWDDDTKALLIAGRSSRSGLGRPEFYVKEQVLGRMKNDKVGTAFTNANGTVITYNGQEKVKIKLGEFDALKFTRVNPKRNTTSSFWYVPGKGFAKLDGEVRDTELVKFTEGAGGDPKVLLDKDNAGKADAAKAFFAAALAASGDDLSKVLALLSKAGQDAQKAAPADLKLFVDTIKKGESPDKAVIWFDGGNVALSSMVFVEGSGEEKDNNVTVTAVLEFEKEGDAWKIKALKATYDKLLK